MGLNSTDSSFDSPPAAQPFFIYIITPQQVTTSTDTNSPVTLYVGVYNPTENGFVPCQYIEFAISIGDTSEEQLTNDWNDVQPTANQSNWGIEKLAYTASPLILKATPAAGITGLEAGESIGFEFTGININGVAGPAPLRILEATDTPPRKTQVLINKVPPSLAITLFQAVPPSVAPGGKTTLSWETTGASYCTLVPLENSICSGETPPKTFPTTGQFDVCPLQTTPYTLTAYAAGGGYVLRSFSVAVGAYIESFTADPKTFYRGEQVTLAWETSAATSCSIDQGVGPVTPPDKGSTPVWPQVETTYTLTASGIGKPTTAPVTVTPEAQGWRQATAPGVELGLNTFAMLSFDNKLWMIDTYNLLVFSSADGGQTWEQITVTQPWTKRGYCTAAVFSDMMWLIGGGQITEFPWPNDLWVSKDGANWSQFIPEAQGLLPRTGFGCVSFQDQLWIFGGQAMVIGPARNDVWSSADGFSWKQVQPSAAWSARSTFASAAFNDEIWLCGGQVGGNPSSDAWYTSDGVTWRQWNNNASPPSPVAPWKVGLYPAAAALNGLLHLVAPNQLWVMDEEMRWTASPLAVPWTGALFNQMAVVYDYQLWVAGFNDATSQPELYAYTP